MRKSPSRQRAQSRQGNGRYFAEGATILDKVQTQPLPAFPVQQLPVPLQTVDTLSWQWKMIDSPKRWNGKRIHKRVNDSSLLLPHNLTSFVGTEFLLIPGRNGCGSFLYPILDLSFQQKDPYSLPIYKPLATSPRGCQVCHNQVVCLRHVCLLNIPWCTLSSSYP